MTPKAVILVLIGISLACVMGYFFLLNSSDVTVVLMKGTEFNPPLAVALFASFIVGVILTMLFAFFSRALVNLKGWKFKKKHQKVLKSRDELVKGRELLASGSFSEAKSLFSKLVKQDESDLLSRSMLAEASFREGDLTQALAVVDGARQDQKNNVELLFLGAAINEKLGNFTPAYDNIKLVLKQQPKNLSALKKLVDLAEPINRLEEGIQYQETLIKHLQGKERIVALDRLAELEMLHALDDSESISPSKLKKKIETVLKRHRDYAPLIAELANIELAAGNKKAASKLFVRAFKASSSPSFLQSAAQIWLDNDEPKLALETVRKSVAAIETSEPNIAGRSCLIRLLMELEMVDAAKEEFQTLISKLSVEDIEDSIELDLLKAELAEKDGSRNEALIALKSAVNKVGLPAPGAEEPLRGLPWNGSPVSIAETSSSETNS